MPNLFYHHKNKIKTNERTNTGKDEPYAALGYAAFKTCLEDNRIEQFTNDEPVEHLVNSEWDDRRNRTLQRALKYARFRLSGNARTDGLRTGQGSEQKSVTEAPSCEFIAKWQDFFITGSTGTGKSFLASAPGRQACLSGYKVLYAGTAKLITRLKTAKTDGSYLKKLATIKKPDVIIHC